MKVASCDKEQNETTSPGIRTRMNEWQTQPTAGQFVSKSNLNFLYYSCQNAKSYICLYSSTKCTSRPSLTLGASSSKSLRLAEGNIIVFTSLRRAAMDFSLT